RATDQRPGVAALPQRVGDGAVGMSGRRMHDQPRGLVDHRQPLVLVHDVERHPRARAGGDGRTGRRVGDLHVVAVADALPRAARTSVDLDQGGGDQRLRRGAGDAAALREPRVEPLRVQRGHGHAVPFCAGCREPRVNTATTMPTTMQESARLNTGQRCRSTKSTTYPWVKRSTALATAPPRIAPRVTWAHTPWAKRGPAKMM